MIETLRAYKVASGEIDINASPSGVVGDVSHLDAGASAST